MIFLSVLKHEKWILKQIYFITKRIFKHQRESDINYKGYLCLWREDSLEEKCNPKFDKICSYLIFLVCK